LTFYIRLQRRVFRSKRQGLGHSTRQWT